MTDFGGKLRQARELRGVSLQQLAARTKIPVAALDALERNDLSRLPGGIFSRAFVRSYALEVGLNPDETVREFLEHFPHEPAVPVAHVSPAAGGLSEDETFESRQRIAKVLFKIILASFVAAAVILYLMWRQPAPPRSSAPAEPPPSSDRAPARGVTLQTPWTLGSVHL
jgi:cytoskeletal protein RodZ